MGNIKYIAEAGMRSLIKGEVETHESLKHIKSPSGFANHLIQTGEIAHQTASTILRNHPTLSRELDPEVTKLAGWMHDFSKPREGGEYHEVGSAHMALIEGDGRLELITGGAKGERTEKLIRIAKCLPSDSALYEELGGNGFPDKALYPKVLPKFLERIEELRRKLSPDGRVFSMEEFALPFSLEQQVLIYADMVNNGEEGRVSVEERLRELKERYGDPGSGYYNPILAGLIDITTPRILVVGRTIENLMQ